MIVTSISCGSKSSNTNTKSLNVNASTEAKDNKAIRVGANRIENYLTLLAEKRVAVVANQTSVIFKTPKDSLKTTDNKHFTHLVDSLLKRNVNITKVFAPEHGFRGKADAGELVKDGIDTQTGLPIVSLYGSSKKPSSKQLENIDVFIFDIQDVGARFYTYISTLHYIMEACAEHNIPLIVLDRPNPNGHYIDGPVLHPEYKSFVGLHPVPVVHGMTIGEYAKMINGEGWLANSLSCKLTVIPVEHYTHNTPYGLAIKPSPNLPNDNAIALYPSLCFFEGTNVSAGRGTDSQFQIYGSPYLDANLYTFTFTPQPNSGAKHPKHEGKLCYGKALITTADVPVKKLHLEWLIDAYKHSKHKASFFNSFFTKLAGSKTLQQQIVSDKDADTIRASWKAGLNAFRITRSKYLIYD